MEELVEILINLITKMMAPKPPAQQTQSGRLPMMPSTPQKPSGHGGAAYKPIPGARALPPSRAAIKAMSPPARRGRRPQPNALIAAPIITGKKEPAPPQPPPMVRATAVQPIVSAQTAKSPAALDPAAIRRWLTPATLRHQFLLTEIFQPPLALRQPREW